MRVSTNFSALKQIKWYEYGVRFVLGGAVTLTAGLLAKRYGPVFGGLFLAFPAIFPAAATLLEKNQLRKKRRAGIMHTARGRQAVALDASGAALGSVGLATFAIVSWKLLPVWKTGYVFVVAVMGWALVSYTLWRIRKKHWLRSR
jgi:hypothetical protein